MFKIPVRGLVEFGLRSGDLTSDYSGPTRRLEAIAAHQKLQKSRPEEYSAEVAVSHRHETDRVIMEISGRIDGLFQNPDRVMVEEIKTTSRNLDESGLLDNQLHWGQVKVYAHLASVMLGLDTIQARVTAFHLDTGETRTRDRTFSADELRIFFQDLIEKYAVWAETLAEWRSLRDASLKETAFPYPEFRSGQRKMSVSVYLAIKRGQDFLVQAPTGIGKTMAAIFPAFKALGERHTEKIFYLTARTTGRLAAEKAVIELAGQGARIKCLTLSARDGICFSQGSDCSAESCAFAKGFFDRLGDAMTDLFARDSWTRDQIAEIARTHRVCPFELSLEASLWADMIVADYNYVFDPRVYLRRFFQNGKNDFSLLVDEAHNLVERARDMFSASLDRTVVAEVKTNLPPSWKEEGRILDEIEAWLASGAGQTRAAGGFMAEKARPEELLDWLGRLIATLGPRLGQGVDPSLKEAILELFFQAVHLTRIGDQFGEADAAVFEEVYGQLIFRILCLDPGVRLKKVLKKCRASIFFSATLSPLDYFRSVFGLENDVPAAILASPFPRENLLVLVADHISTFYRQRERTLEAVGRAILTLIQGQVGNYLVFFPSYHYLDRVHDTIAGRIQGTVLKQAPNMSEYERTLFLAKFNRNNPCTVVGFAVLGGIFGEGLDLAGDRLTGAAIVGLGLPKVGPQRELLRAHFEETLSQGYEFAYLFPGLGRVLQASGRVIRSETDRGVVLLIDQRYARFQVQNLIPDHWLPVRVRSESQMARALAGFWSSDRAPVPEQGALPGTG